MPVAAIAALVVTAVLLAAVAVFLVVVVVLLVRIVRTLDDIVPAISRVADQTEPLEAVLAPIEDDLVALADASSGDGRPTS